MYSYIKLTNGNGRTKGGMQWSIGVTNHATGKGNKLCTDGVLHVYDTPEQAAFMLHVHVPDYTRAFEVSSRCKGVTDRTKRGIKSCTVVREITLPEITTEQRVEIAIRASLLVYSSEEYVRWANDWLSGKDRSSSAAYAAANAAANDAAKTGFYAACAAARATVYAARAAADGIDLLSIIDEVLNREVDDE